jgi:hypothetical protein
MRRTISWLVLGALVAWTPTGQAAFAAPRAPKPQLNRCPDLEPLLDGQVPRSKPVVVPKEYDSFVKATRDRLAIATLSGATHCVDMRLRGEVAGFSLTPDNRFFGFDWKGYEADGHVLVDRTQAGQQVDTGGAPVFSPSRQRFAAVHQSESAFGELEGLGVWQVDAAGFRQVALVSTIPEMLDWQVDGWSGEDCINLSAIPFSRAPSAGADYSGIARDRYTARPSGATWRVVRAIGKGC